MSDQGKGLGDIYPKGQDPLEKYYDTVRQGVSLSRRKWMVKPQWKPPKVPGGEAIQRVYEEHILPRNWQQLVDLWTKLQCGTYFVKNPNWVEPPITAVCLDCRVEDCVEIAGGTLGVTKQTVKTFTVPDRHVGTLIAFGHELQNPVHWGQVTWRILINNKEIRCYGATQDSTGIKQQIGSILNPTRFPNPIRLKYKDVVTVTLDVPAGITACAFMRLTGWMWPVTKLTQDGSFGEYHSL